MQRLFRFLSILLLLPSFSLPALAQRGPKVNDIGGGTWNLYCASPSVATMTQSPNTGQGPNGESTVLDVTVNQAQDPFYLIQLSHEIDYPLPVGDRLELHFWARAQLGNNIRAIVEQQAAPYTECVARIFDLTPSWTEYTFYGDSTGYASGEAAVRLQVGMQAGTIEFAGVGVYDLGPDPAMTGAQAAISPGQIQARIHKFRMADLTVDVFDKSGRPASGAQVSVQQTRHAFLFGSNIFYLKPDDDSALQKSYQNEFTALFNYATLPFYWSSFETQQGHPQFDRLNAMADWCAAHGITTKAHPLVWHMAYPTWWAPENIDSTIPLLHKRVTDIVTQERPRIHYYDIVNEANSATALSPPDGESLWIRRDGAPKVVETALGWARSVPGSSGDVFIYNDFDRSETNVDMLKQMRKDGVFPDVIGIQSHMHYGKWALTDIWMTCQRFAQFGVPIHFTETTVISGGTHIPVADGQDATDWPTTPAGEADQADYAVKFYSILFSHPNVHAITWWDFTDQNAWMGAPAGLVRKDMSPKPAYTRLLDLVRHQWWTNTAGTTGKAGMYRVHAFYGNYTVTVKDRSGRSVQKSIVMPEGSGPKTVIVQL